MNAVNVFVLQLCLLAASSADVHAAALSQTVLQLTAHSSSRGHLPWRALLHETLLQHERAALLLQVTQ